MSVHLRLTSAPTRFSPLAPEFNRWNPPDRRRDAPGTVNDLLRRETTVSSITDGRLRLLPQRCAQVAVHCDHVSSAYTEPEIVMRSDGGAVLRKHFWRAVRLHRRRVCEREVRVG